MTTIISFWILDDLDQEGSVCLADEALEAGRAGQRSVVLTVPELGGNVYVIYDGDQPPVLHNIRQHLREMG